MESDYEQSIIIFDSDESEGEKEQDAKDHEGELAASVKLQMLMKPGAIVEVYSGTYNIWSLGHISRAKTKPGYFTAKYEISDTPYRKLLRPDSDQVRLPPGVQRVVEKSVVKVPEAELQATPWWVTAGKQTETREARDDYTSSSSEDDCQGTTEFTKRLAGDNLKHVLCYGHFNQMPQCIADALRLRWIADGAFATKSQLKFDCELVYVGPADEDVVVRVFQRCLKKDAHHEYRYVGFIHSMQPGDRTVHVHARGEKYHLAVEIRRGLNKISFGNKSIDQVQAQVRTVYSQLITNHCESKPERADFLLVLSSRDVHLNNTFVWHLQQFGISSGPWGNGKRSITVCTDSSLGIGFHHDENVELCLGGLEFAKASSSWWEVFAQAANQTVYGVLVFNPETDWMDRHDYQKELAGIPIHRRFFFVRESDSIVSWQHFFGVVVEKLAPIIQAASHNYVFEVDTLLMQDAQAIHAEDNQQRTALHYAAMYGHEAVVKQLLDAKADLERWSNGGTTPLHLAALSGHGAMIKQLVSAQADVGARSLAGRTPLHFAALGGRVVAVRRLLEEHADVHCQDQDSETPLDYALNPGPDVTKRTDHDEVAYLLRSEGALLKEAVPAAWELVTATGGNSVDALTSALDSAKTAGVGLPLVSAATTKQQRDAAAARLTEAMELHLGESQLRKAIEDASEAGVDARSVRTARARVERFAASRQLKEAMRSQDAQRLRLALAEAKSKDVEADTIIEAERLDNMLLAEQELVELSVKKDLYALEKKLRQARELGVSEIKLKGAQKAALRLKLESLTSAHDETGLAKIIPEARNAGISANILAPSEAELRLLLAKKAMGEALKSTRVDEKNMRRVLVEAEGAGVPAKFLEQGSQKLAKLVAENRLVEAIKGDSSSWLARTLDNATRVGTSSDLLANGRSRLDALEVQDAIQAAAAADDKVELQELLSKAKTMNDVDAAAIKEGEKHVARIQAIGSVGDAVRRKNEIELQSALKSAAAAGATPSALSVGQASLARLQAERKLIDSFKSENPDELEAALRHAKDLGLSEVVLQRAEKERLKDQLEDQLVKAVENAPERVEINSLSGSIRAGEKAGVRSAILSAAEKKLHVLIVEEDLEDAIRQDTETQLRIAIEKGKQAKLDSPAFTSANQRLSQLIAMGGLKDALTAGDPDGLRHWIQAALDNGVDSTQITAAERNMKRIEARRELIVSLNANDDQRLLKSIEKAKKVQLSPALISSAETYIPKAQCTKSLEKAIADRDLGRLQKLSREARSVGVAYASIREAEKLVGALNATAAMQKAMEKGDEAAMRAAVEDAIDWGVDERTLASGKAAYQKLKVTRELRAATQTSDAASLQRALGFAQKVRVDKKWIDQAERKLRELQQPVGGAAEPEDDETEEDEEDD